MKTVYPLQTKFAGGIMIAMPLLADLLSHSLGYLYD